MKAGDEHAEAAAVSLLGPRRAQRRECNARRRSGHAAQRAEARCHQQRKWPGADFSRESSAHTLRPRPSDATWRPEGLSVSTQLVLVYGMVWVWVKGQNVVWVSDEHDAEYNGWIDR